METRIYRVWCSACGPCGTGVATGRNLDDIEYVVLHGHLCELIALEPKAELPKQSKAVKAKATMLERCLAAPDAVKGGFDGNTYR